MDCYESFCSLFSYLPFNNVIPFPNHPCCPNIIPKKIKPQFFTGGLGAKPPSYLMVSCQNWKVLVSWRYDFLGIVTTMPELAKTEQGL
ncbi:hypothetical protein EQH23_05340 [Streptococcus pneumoniae]|uniref:hypothetical protein n=5 Tax=Streptococcus pneumoniae TaxID=1313 RepID=UPI00099024DD|nr:hypothetical protein [Streptococcus pneumoniae]MDA5252825.1 hypothetical protein [Streptococcus pneumoniae]MDA5264865.1 hypothetical protein [Streptococcus pneumoniae]PAV99833.1 hypothetical protein CJ013_02270 [Streptococcus pneumoniae]TNW41255.1 hypothetical protein FIU68_06250 [Streptococcus pneumoniae]UKP58346.1 hypothetical protein EQH23_05340 [Streptococcus pneumoniae]